MFRAFFGKNDKKVQPELAYHETLTGFNTKGTFFSKNGAYINFTRDYIHPSISLNHGFMKMLVLLELEAFYLTKLQEEVSCDRVKIELEEMTREELIEKYETICKNTSNISITHRIIDNFYILVVQCEDVLDGLNKFYAYVVREIKTNIQKKQSACKLHFSGRPQPYDVNEDMNEMIRLCIEENIELEGIHLLLFRDLRNSIRSGTKMSEISFAGIENVKKR